LVEVEKQVIYKHEIRHWQIFETTVDVEIEEGA